MTEHRLSLEEYACLLAQAAAARSEDPYLKVGCALIRHDKTVAATGYNGAPSGVEIDWDERDQRRSRVIHAEANALRYVEPGEVLFAASTHLPCVECVKSLASYGVRLVVYLESLDESRYDIEEIHLVAAELGVELVRPYGEGDA